jgi:hypothetical protein
MRTAANQSYTIENKERESASKYIKKELSWIEMNWNEFNYTELNSCPANIVQSQSLHPTKK